MLYKKNALTMAFHLRIATLEKVVFEEEVSLATLPGEAGEFSVLPSHMPLITPLKLGEVTARKNGEEFYMAISGGMAEIQPHRVLVLAEEAERAEEIDEKHAEAARKKAEELMKEKHSDVEGFAGVQAELERALLRLKIARKHRSARGIRMEQM